MSLLDLLNPIKDVADLANSIIGKFVTDPTEKLQLQTQLLEQQTALQGKAIDLQGQLADAQSKVITAEAQGSSWMQRNWRPITMLSFVAIMLNNFVLAPYATAFGAHIPTLTIPDPMWGLLTVGIGGYIGARTVEKVKGAS